MEYTILNSFINQKKKKTEESTYKGYESDIRLFLDDINLVKKIDNEIELLQSLDGKKYESVIFVQDIFDNMEIEYKKSSINKKIASISLFFDYLVKLSIVEKTPMLSIEKHSECDDSVDKEILTKEEMLTLLSALDKHKAGDKSVDFTSRRDKLLLSLMFCTGLRISEALNIKFSDMEEVENGIMVNIEKHKTSKKNGSKRIPIANKCLEFYESYIEERDKMEKIIDTDYLFLSYRGKELSPSACNQNLNKLLEKSDINKKITPHCQRHSFRNIAIANNVNLELILMMGGWSLKGMGKIYTHDSNNFDQAKIEASNLL